MIEGDFVITNLLPYPFYKSSGVDWLGEVPAHWEVRPLKHWVGINEKVLSEATDSDFGFDYLEIGAVSAGVLTDEPRRIRFGDAPSRARRVVSRGDTIVSTVRSYLKAVWFADETDTGLICSTGFAVLTPRQGTIPKYVGYLVQSSSFIDQMTAESVGIAYPAISKGKFSSSRVCIPPLAEQRAIVCYLDHVDRRIQRYIEAKEKLIALLQEARQAIIERAVTRGLDPSVPLKASGVEWLGDVPAHWEVRRLRYLIEGGLIYGANAAAEHDNPNWPRYLRITDFGLDGKLRDDTFRSLPPEIAKDYLVKPGDLLLARSGATVGKAFLVTSEIGQACHAGYLIRARPKGGLIDPGFLFAFTQSSAFSCWKDSVFIIATIQNISAEKYANLPVPSPPLEEQQKIVAHLDKTTAGIDASIDSARRQVEFMNEYRASLIAHVVTGKLDVRAAAEQLPQEARELTVS